MRMLDFGHCSLGGVSARLAFRRKRVRVFPYEELAWVESVIAASTVRWRGHCAKQDQSAQPMDVAEIRMIAVSTLRVSTKLGSRGRGQERANSECHCGQRIAHDIAGP